MIAHCGEFQYELMAVGNTFDYFKLGYEIIQCDMIGVRIKI